MITKEQLKLLKIFKKDFFKSLTFTEFKKKLKEPSNSKLQKAIADFEREKIINIKKIGKSKLISLNFNSNRLFEYFSIIDLEFIENNIFKDISETIQETQEEILKETPFFSLIIFGSHAENKQTTKSDLDLAVITEDLKIKKKIIPRINSIKRKSLKEVDIHIFTKDEFLEMIRDEKENLGKEITKNNIVPYGLINFYKLILGGNKDVGFS